MNAPTTLAQKLVAQAAGRAHVEPGEIVMCNVDLAMSHDSSGPRRIEPMLKELGATIRHPDRYVVVTDHYVPPVDEESRAIVQFTRDWVKKTGLRHFHDNEGICHVVLPEKGYIRPGMFIVGGDSHSPTGGAFGAYMMGVGATEMLGVLVTGQIWLKVPETILIEWTDGFAEGVSSKDVMLFLCGRFGMNGGQYQAVEFTGEAITALSLQERMTLSNMTAEFGGQVGLVAPDDTVFNHLRGCGVAVDHLPRWRTDEGAALRAHHRFSAGALAPQVAAPHSPANAADVTAHEGQVIDIAYIGACTGAKLDDMRMAARVLQGHRVASGVTLMLAPASAKDQAQAAAEGTLEVLLDAGAELLPNACGACAGYGRRFEGDARVISTTARNFKGRMGSPTSRVWLASPYTVAASALTGSITDPRKHLA